MNGGISKMNRFQGKIVLVTGGGSGIGRATALAFAREGATVVVAGRREGPLAETVDLVRQAGGQGEALPVDITSEAQVASLVGTIVQRYGRLHVAFNNAGILGNPGPLNQASRDNWCAVMETNLIGMWLCMKHEIAQMKVHGGGAIVNMAANIGEHMAIPYMSAYSASKAAVSALTRVAALECIADGIRINCVSPGLVDTAMSLLPGESRAERDARVKGFIPAGRVADPAEIASAVLWLASDDAAFVVGHDLVIDGGASL